MPKREVRSSERRAASAPQHGTNAVLEYLKANNLPLTRESYIAHNWLPIPDLWTAEHEMELPEEFQLTEQDFAALQRAQEESDP